MTQSRPAHRAIADVTPTSRCCPIYACVMRRIGAVFLAAALALGACGGEEGDQIADIGWALAYFNRDIEEVDRIRLCSYANYDWDLLIGLLGDEPGIGIPHMVDMALFLR